MKFPWSGKFWIFVPAIGITVIEIDRTESGGEMARDDIGITVISVDWKVEADVSETGEVTQKVVAARRMVFLNSKNQIHTKKYHEKFCGFSKRVVF